MERGRKNPESCDLETATLLLAVAIIYLLNHSDLAVVDRTHLKMVIGSIALLQFVPIEQLYQETKKHLEMVLSSQESHINRENTQTGDD